jgi:hypothetical protein
MNGNVIVIEERRRRPARELQLSQMSAIVSASTAQEGNPTGVFRPDSSRQPKNSSSSAVKPRRRRSSAVVIESRDTRAKTRPEVAAVIAELTPPPTPRIRRLNTPELPELDQAVLCDCCKDPIQKLLCGRCGQEVELSLKRSLDKQLNPCNCRWIDANKQQAAVRDVSGFS